MNPTLNQRASQLIEEAATQSEQLRIASRSLPGGGRVIDFGIHTAGGLEAGLLLTRICMSGLCDLNIVSGDIDGISWPHVNVTTDHPTSACLLSQYAGWQISVGDFFGMGSGPMRAAASVEELFDKLDYRESATHVVGVLETRSQPDDAVVEMIARKSGVPPENVVLCTAPTASIAGNLQIVARSVETALHKLFELGFDVNRIASGFGSAPLSPVAADDMQAIGRTNDAILYGGRVTLWVHGDDDSLADIGPKIPSSASDCYGQPFLQIFEEAGRDFYSIDPHLFSPAEIVFQNVDTGNVHRFGQTAPDILQTSFGI